MTTDLRYALRQLEYARTSRTRDTRVDALARCKDALERLLEVAEAREAEEDCVAEIWDVASSMPSVSMSRAALVENEYRTCGYSLPECMERLATLEAFDAAG